MNSLQEDDAALDAKARRGGGFLLPNQVLLDPPGIGWSSDLGRALGFGRPLEIAVSTLSNGDHLITDVLEAGEEIIFTDGFEG